MSAETQVRRGGEVNDLEFPVVTYYTHARSVSQPVEKPEPE